MAFDQPTRNRLQRFVSAARALLSAEFTRQLQHEYGMNPATGEVAVVEKLGHLDDTRRETARLLRDTLAHYLATSPSSGKREALERIVREQAFTVLNRLAALRMMEARGLLLESVARGYQSRGFQLYQRLAGSALGETGDTYRCYLFSLFDEFALDLAVRNQFFTPRYVVEFLIDNTMGRLWYEMTQGKTALQDQCSYLVRRPNEVFLQPGEAAPEADAIPFRALKDPRDITMLDPACGSMHFGLYAFDLYEQIYDEAWELEGQVGAANLARSQKLKPLHDTYATKDDFRRDVPRLIIEHNIHGIDIDPRAVQIAGLSLWLRAQRSWQSQDVKLQQRPQIQCSHIICAEPMPGEKDLLQEFATGLTPRVLGQLVELIFDRMQLADEAGSLLKIEVALQEAIDQAREEFNRELLHRKETEGFLIPEVAPERAPTLFDFADLPDRTHFWGRAEPDILAALKTYAEQAEGMQANRKRLFAHDAARGFALIDLCRERYDVVVMNPPFGEASQRSKAEIAAAYPRTKNDLYAACVERGLSLLRPGGMLGAITSRTGFFLSSFRKWREEILLQEARPTVFADLGYGVLDTAMVETAAYCLEAVGRG